MSKHDTPAPKLFWLRYFIYFLVFFTPLLMPGFLHRQYDYPKFFFGQTVMLVFCILFWICIRRGVINFPKSILQSIGAIAASLTLSTLFSNHFSTSLFGFSIVSYLYSYWHIATLLIFSCTLIIWITKQEVTHRLRFIEELILYGTTGSLLLGFDVLREILANTDILFTSFRLRSTIGEPNRLGFYLITILPFQFYLSQSDIRWKKILGFITLLISLVGLLFTFSRGSWLVLFVCLILFIRLMHFKHWIARQTPLHLVLWIAVLVFIVTSPHGTRITKHINVVRNDIDQQTGSISIRLNEWQTTVKVFLSFTPKQWLLGLGPQNGSYTLLQNRTPQSNISTDQRDWRTYIIRNHYLETLVSTGILGLSGWVFFIGTFCYFFYKERHTLNFLKRCLFFSWFNILFVGMIYYLSIELWIFFWIITAILTTEIWTSHFVSLSLHSLKFPFLLVLSCILFITFAYAISDTATQWQHYTWGKNLLPWESQYQRMAAQHFATVYLKTKNSDDLQKARENGQQAVSSNSLEVDNYVAATLAFYRSGIEIEKKYLTQALYYGQQAVILDPSRARPYDDLGLILLALKRLPDARDNFERASKLNPDYRQSLLHLGEVYKQQHDFIQAKHYYQTAIQRWPGWVTAQQELDKLETLMKNK